MQNLESRKRRQKLKSKILFRRDKMDNFIESFLSKFFPDENLDISAIMKNEMIMKTFKRAFTPYVVDKVTNYQGLEKVGDMIFDILIIKYASSEYKKKMGKDIEAGQLAYIKDSIKADHIQAQIAEEMMLYKYITGGMRTIRDQENLMGEIFQAFLGALDFAFCTIEKSEIAGYPHINKCLQYFFSKDFANGRFVINITNPELYKDPSSIVQDIYGKTEIRQTKNQIGGFFYATETIVIDGTAYTFIAGSRVKREAKRNLSQQVIRERPFDFMTIGKKKIKITDSDIVKLEKGGYAIIFSDKNYIKFSEAKSKKEALEMYKKMKK